MLCSRSASLMRTTRMSSAIARNIFRMFSACCCSWLWVLNLRQLGDAVDEVGDLGPEALLDVGEAVLGVLGDVVEQRGASTATGSMPSSARIWADAIGWVTYGSPDARTWRRVGLDGEVEGALDDRRGRPAGGGGWSSASSGGAAGRPGRARARSRGAAGVAPVAPRPRGRAAVLAPARCREGHLGIADDGLGHARSLPRVPRGGPVRPRSRTLSPGGHRRGRR